jgi:hypothetical protein
LFRATSTSERADERSAVLHAAPEPVDATQAVPVEAAAASEQPSPARGTLPHRSREGRTPSGRQRHEEKITVYVSGAELVELERARLVLRAEHGLAVDRGRIVREALAVVLADLDAKEGDSILVRRLRGR